MGTVVNVSVPGPPEVIEVQVPGLQGAQGPQGIQGLQGIPGPAGGTEIVIVDHVGTVVTNKRLTITLDANGDISDLAVE